MNSFRQDELDRFRKYELNSFGQWPNFVEGGLTKALGYERISNPTVHVILRDQTAAVGKIQDIADQQEAVHQPNDSSFLCKDERAGIPGVGKGGSQEAR